MNFYTNLYNFPDLSRAKSNQQKALLSASRRGYRVMGDGKVYNPKGKVLSLYENAKGYLHFSLRIKGKFSVAVHRLQAFQKYGFDLYQDGIEVRHLNNNNQDNSYENIAIGTTIDNEMDKPKSVRLESVARAADKS